jgi:hypothetical protein
VRFEIECNSNSNNRSNLISKLIKKPLTSNSGQQLPMSARRPYQAQPTAKQRSPTCWCSLSFSFLSLTCGTCASASLFFLLLHFSPQHCIAPRRIPPHRTSARAMGQSGRWLAGTPSQGAPVCSPRGLPRGKTPLPFLRHA